MPREVAHSLPNGLHQTDLFHRKSGLPKSRPQRGKWIVLAFFVGVLTALVLVAITYLVA